MWRSQYQRLNLSVKERLSGVGYQEVPPMEVRDTHSERREHVQWHGKRPIAFGTTFVNKVMSHGFL
ncbi:MAG: hypothetical protein KatS3mg107_0776 [Gemmataceae bacterium]|jgi:hypothetical protein|nr:MAG: hypothetical protein KatS3mg107_0776 [Gemmataceae bacterium]